jgi:4-hydroxy-tetrahydrodipicolinate synthase
LLNGLSKEEIILSFEGIFAPLVTPLNKNYEVNWDAFRALLDKLIEGGLHGVVPMGTAGEFPMFTTDERMKIAEGVADHINGRTKLIVGTAAPSTHEALMLTKHAKDIGAEAVMVANPWYLKPSDEGLLWHYRELAKADIPILAYNIPSATGSTMPIHVVSQLAEEGTLAGIKDSSGVLGHVITYIRETPPGDVFSVLPGIDTIFLASMMHGAMGGVLGTSMVIPKKVVELYTLAREGKYELANEIQNDMSAIIQYVFLGVFPAGLKQLVTEALNIDMGDPRPPLSPLTEEQRQKIAEFIKNLQLE